VKHFESMLRQKEEATSELSETMKAKISSLESEVQRKSHEVLRVVKPFFLRL
jgi:hypothetical protein